MRTGQDKDRKDAILRPRSLSATYCLLRERGRYMTSSGKIHGSAGCKWVAILLFTCFLSLLAATPAAAQLVVRKSGPAT